MSVWMKWLARWAIGIAAALLISKAFEFILSAISPETLQAVVAWEVAQIEALRQISPTAMLDRFVLMWNDHGTWYLLTHPLTVIFDLFLPGAAPALPPSDSVLPSGPLDLGDYILKDGPAPTAPAQAWPTQVAVQCLEMVLAFALVSASEIDKKVGPLYVIVIPAAIIALACVLNFAVYWTYLAILVITMPLFKLGAIATTTALAASGGWAWIARDIGEHTVKVAQDAVEEHTANTIKKIVRLED